MKFIHSSGLEPATFRATAYHLNHYSAATLNATELRVLSRSPCCLPRSRVNLDRARCSIIVTSANVTDISDSFIMKAS
jgi:hypothetical protein